MSKFIDPICAVPLYLAKNKRNVKKCGLIDGYIMASVIVFFIIFVIIRKYKINTVTKITSIIGINVGIMLGIPYLYQWYHLRKWQVRQKQLKVFKDKGFKEKEAIRQVKTLKENDSKLSDFANITTVASMFI